MAARLWVGGTGAGSKAAASISSAGKPTSLGSVLAG